MTAENSYGDYTKKLENPIKLRLTGKIRDELEMDYETTARGQDYGDDHFEDDPMLQMFDKYKTRIVVETEGQAADLLSQICCGVLGGRLSYDNTQMQKAGVRVRDELAEALVAQDREDLVKRYYDDEVVTSNY